MTIEVVAYDDPKAVLDMAEPFLAAEPVLNNLILTVLADRILHPEPGRYWIASEHHQVIGMALHAPIFRPVALSAMLENVAAAMGRAIAAERQRSSFSPRPSPTTSAPCVGSH